MAYFFKEKQKRKKADENGYRVNSSLKWSNAT